MSHQCSVCSGLTTQFNYGVKCCNACKMFFRRTLITNQQLKCKNQGLCFSTSISNFSCRKCRLQQCFQLGMRSKMSSELQLSKKLDSLSVTINALSVLYAHQKNLTDNYHITENLGFDQFFRIAKFNFVARPKNSSYSAFDWGALEQVISIDFLRKFADKLISQLSDTDNKIFISETFYKISIFRVAMSCYQRKIDKLQFPNGIDIIPSGIISESSKISSNLLIRMRTLLIRKLIELDMSKEEFLLINAIIVLNPVIPGLSPEAVGLVASYQRNYANVLLQYCLINYQKNGPSRFTELLSLITVINDSMEDRKAFFILLGINGSSSTSTSRNDKRHLVDDSIRRLCK